MSTFRRHRFPWSHNELERLNREYENQELTVQEIAALHERSVMAIFFKLESEGLINKWQEARGWSAYSKEMCYSDQETDSVENEDGDYEEGDEEDGDYEEEDEEEDKDDGDYEEEDEEDEEDEEYDAYSIKQQMNFLQTQINNIRRIVSGILYDSSSQKTNKGSFAESYN
jgi:TATA-binding protein-associated factor Taf7